MNEIQTAEFAIRCSVAVVILLLGAACCEIYRALLKAQAEAERLRKLNSVNYHHRITMQRAIDAYCNSTDYDITKTEAAHKAMVQACKESKYDSNADTMGRVRVYKLRANPMGGL